MLSWVEKPGRTTKGYSVVLPVRENPGQNYHISQISAISLAVFVIAVYGCVLKALNPAAVRISLQVFHGIENC